MLSAGEQDEMFYTTNYKQSNRPEDGLNYPPKHVELIEIFNKIIIVASSCLFIYYCIKDGRSHKH